MDPRYGGYQAPQWQQTAPTYHHPQAQYFQHHQQPAPAPNHGTIMPQQPYSRQPVVQVVIPQKHPAAYQNPRPVPQPAPHHHHVQHQQFHQQPHAVPRQNYANSAPRPQVQSASTIPPRPQGKAQVPSPIPAKRQHWQMDGAADKPVRAPPTQPTPQRSRPQISQSQAQPQQQKPRAPTKPQLPPTPDAEPAASVRPPKSSGPPIDCGNLLFTLSDEYITAAYRMGPTVARTQKEDDLEQYHELIAYALGCMEAALKNWKWHPRQEAELRLKLASLLYQETENDFDAEEILGQGIPLCERNKLDDIKYSMHYLLARVVAKSKPRAAAKSLDKLIPNVEAYQHVSWVYAFRFLRVFLSFQNPSSQASASANPLQPATEVNLGHHVALQNLRAITKLSEKRNDHAVFVTAVTLEALILLRHDNSPDGIEQAQRAIASARSLQLHGSVQALTQVLALLNCIDLACSLQMQQPEDSKKKLETLRVAVEEANKSNPGDEDTLRVLVENRGTQQSRQYVGGVMEKNDDGRDVLVFSWLPQKAVYMLCYYLSGVATTLRAHGGNKAREYLLQGLRMIKEFQSPSTTFTQSYKKATGTLSWLSDVAACMHLQACLVACQSSNWSAASAHLAEAKASAPSNVHLEPLWQYLSGTMEQGRGNLDAAVAHYQAPSLVIPGNITRSTNATTDLCILAALNSLFILRDPSHPKHYTALPLLSQLEPLCSGHSNKSIISAFYLVKATCFVDRGSLVPTKQNLTYVLNTSKQVENQQIMCICFNYMTAQFFTGIVSGQATKSAVAGKQLSQKAGSSLWTCVAEGMYADTLDTHGKSDEARASRTAAIDMVAGLPEPLQRECLP